MRRIAGAALAALIGCLGVAGAAVAAPALWRVSDADSQVYLFGTLHALNADARWRTPLYDEVLARAGTVWFEVDMGSASPAKVSAIVQRYGVDRERPLSRKLSAADRRALAREINVASIDHLRPWVAAMVLSMQPMLSRGASIEAGADAVATRSARAAGDKNIRAFETLEEQARMFASLPEPAELRYLSDVIRDRSRLPRVALPPPPKSMESAWRNGDLDRLSHDLIGQMRVENPDFYEALLKRRNEAWADKLAREMAAGAGVELVNVGALHMVGADGLPALLAARGYKVERLQ